MKITSIFSRVKHYPIFFGLPLLVGVLFVFWWLQQNNVNLLSQSINDLQQQIEKMPSSDLKSSLGKDLVGLRKDQVVLQNKVYETLVQGLGGAFFFVTAYLTWRNIKATEEKQITERFSQAVGFLGKPELEVRLGGVYALERISRDSKKDYWQIIEILTAYVRTNGKKVKQTNLEDADLQESDFSGADLTNANLARANLAGASFERADLSKANLSGAILDNANFSGAILTGANLSNVKIDKIIGLTRSQIQQARQVDVTSLPDYLK